MQTRVISQHRRLYLVQSEEEEELTARLSKGRAERLAAEGLVPVVGDWVVIEKDDETGQARIVGVEPRQNKLSRRSAGKEVAEQVIAANIDIVLIVTAVGHEFNVRRLERYLALAHETGAYITLVLNKVDGFQKGNEARGVSKAIGGGGPLDSVDGVLDDEMVSQSKAGEGPEDPVESGIKGGLGGYLKAIRGVAPDIRTFALSSKSGVGLKELQGFLEPGKTAVLIGSSGVGKSTIINALLGYERQEVFEIREHDAHGRHTTTSRELITLPSGAMLIDNPGIREIQLWLEGEGLTRTFSEISELAQACRFSDCSHQREPGCAVRQAVEAGELEAERLESYLKLQKEQLATERKRSRKAQKAKGKMFARYRKEIYKVGVRPKEKK